jgi:hypothetical protein
MAIPAEVIQIHALDTILTGRWIHDSSSFLQFIIAVLLCLMLAWLVANGPALKGAVFALGAVIAYMALVIIALTAAQWILPLTIPVTAAAFVILSGILLEHAVSSRRVALMEKDMFRIHQELVSVREALVCRENAVDALEEDLESARLSATSSADRQQALLRTTEELRLQMADARQLEDHARRRSWAQPRRCFPLIRRWWLI